MMDFGMPYLLEMHSVEECCQLAKELGLAFVELNANFPDCDLDRLDYAKLRRCMEQYGIYFTLHVEEECNPFAFNGAVRAAWLNTLRRSFLLAAALDMPVVNMHLPAGVYITLPDRKTYLFSQYRNEYMAACKELRELCEEALADTDTVLCIENTSGWQAHEQEAIGYLIESPRIALTLDIGHNHGAGLVDEAFFRQHSRKLHHMHGHDALGRKNHLALGDGEIDLRERFAWAETQQARIVLETKTIEALRTSVARLPEILAEKAKKS